jgi:hypothetical protein
LGFEAPITVEAFARAMLQTYNLVLALLLEGVGPSFAGDLFLQVLGDEPEWVNPRLPRLNGASDLVRAAPQSIPPAVSRRCRRGETLASGRRTIDCVSATALESWGLPLTCDAERRQPYGVLGTRPSPGLSDAKLQPSP